MHANTCPHQAPVCLKPTQVCAAHLSMQAFASRGKLDVALTLLRQRPETAGKRSMLCCCWCADVHAWHVQ